MNAPPALALTMDGEWHSYQTTKSMVGCQFRLIIWCRKPTYEDVLTVQHCIEDRAGQKMLDIMELANPKENRTLGTYMIP